MNIEDVVHTIINGDLDESLEGLLKTIRRRQEIIGQIRAAHLKVGDRVVLQGLGMGAKYLNGATGTIIGFATKNIKVRIDPEVDTRRYGHQIKVPPTLLRKLVIQTPELETDYDRGPHNYSGPGES